MTSRLTKSNSPAPRTWSRLDLGVESISPSLTLVNDQNLVFVREAKRRTENYFRYVLLIRLPHRLCGTDDKNSKTSATVPLSGGKSDLVYVYRVRETDFAQSHVEPRASSAGYIQVREMILVCTSPGPCIEI